MFLLSSTYKSEGVANFDLFMKISWGYGLDPLDHSPIPYQAPYRWWWRWRWWWWWFSWGVEQRPGWREHALCGFENIMETSVLSQYCSIAGSIIRATHWACSWFILPPNLLMPVMLAVTLDHWDQTENCQENCLGNDGRFFHHSGATNGEPVTNGKLITSSGKKHFLQPPLHNSPIKADLTRPVGMASNKTRGPLLTAPSPQQQKTQQRNHITRSPKCGMIQSIWRRHAETAKYFRNSAQQNWFSA